MIEYDVHLHSDYSTDSEEKMENTVEKAVSLGLKGLCFTDHMDLYFPQECAKKSGGDFTFDPDAYFDELEYLKSKYRNRIEILFGIETGLRNESELKDKCIDEYRRMIRDYPFDFVIGSTHCLENIDPYWEEYWYGRTAEEGLDRYFDAIDQNCNDYDFFDSLGHLDYLVRYVSKDAAIRSFKERFKDLPEESSGFDWEEQRVYGRRLYRPSDFKEITEQILKRIIDRGTALEINTAGLKYGLGFAHPHEEILKLYKELGGELLTVGSDAHMAEHLAYDFRDIPGYLKNLGFKYYFVYKRRKPEGYLL